MKRILSLLLSVFLAAAPGSAAFSESADRTLYRVPEASEEEVVFSCPVGGGFCAVTWNGGYTVILFGGDGRESARYPLRTGGDGARIPEEAEQEEILGWLSRGEELYALTGSGGKEEKSGFEDSRTIRPVRIREGWAETAEEGAVPLDWTGSETENPEAENPETETRGVSGLFCEGDWLYAVQENGDGEKILSRFDLKTGRREDRTVQRLQSACPAGNGRVLLVTRPEENESGGLRVSLYDPDSGAAEAEACFPEGHEGAEILCCDPDSGALYYAENGMLYSAAEHDPARAETVNDCPVQPGACGAQRTAEGQLLIRDGKSVLLRSVGSAGQSRTVIEVRDYTGNDALEKTLFRFADRYGSLSAAISRRESADDLLQAMMNRDGSVDVYCVRLSGSQYGAAAERGYPVDLSGSERLREAAEAMYPAIREVLFRNGKLQAFPVSAEGYTIGYSPAALERIGLSAEALPGTWDGFFDFLESLPERMEGTGVSAFSSIMDRQSLKRDLFSCLLRDYQNLLNRGEVPYAFHTPAFSRLLEKLNRVDYDALGVKRAENGNAERFDMSVDEEGAVLLSTHTQTVLSARPEETVPLLMSVGEEEASASYDLCVAFVNPYSEHIPEAVLFLETAADAADEAARLNFYPECTEPVRSADYAETAADLDSELEEIRESLSKAEDGDRAELLEIEAELLAEREKNEKDGWSIRPETVQGFLERAPHLIPMTYDFTVSMTGENDRSLQELISRYVQEECTPAELLDELDRKVRLMRMEGN